MRKCHRTCILHHNSQFKSWITIFNQIKALEKWFAVFRNRWPAFLLKLYANNCSQNPKRLLPCGMLATHTHTQLFYGPFSGTPGWAGARRELLDFMVQRKINRADTLTIRLGATPSELSSAHLHHPQSFLQAGCPSCSPTNSVKALKATAL